MPAFGNPGVRLSFLVVWEDDKGKMHERVFTIWKGERLQTAIAEAGLKISLLDDNVVFEQLCWSDVRCSS